jgi:hypothetical protein
MMVMELVVMEAVPLFSASLVPATDANNSINDWVAESYLEWQMAEQIRGCQ